MNLDATAKSFKRNSFIVLIRLKEDIFLSRFVHALQNDFEKSGSNKEAFLSINHF